VVDPASFQEKLSRPGPLLGTCITLNDAIVTEALSDLFDFVWIDTEHNPMPLDVVQAHVMATKGSNSAALVRVPANDPNLIKPVLDLGASGVIVPLVRTVDDVRRAVAACKYPPEGIRGFGPRRASHYGQRSGPDYIRWANEHVVCVVQIELTEAVDNLAEIVRVPGLTSIVVGPNDLASSMGFPGQPGHPKVKATIEGVAKIAGEARMPIGLAWGADEKEIHDWHAKGIKWFSLANDFTLLTGYVKELADRLRG